MLSRLKLTSFDGLSNMLEIFDQSVVANAIDFAFCGVVFIGYILLLLFSCQPYFSSYLIFTFVFIAAVYVTFLRHKTQTEVR